MPRLLILSCSARKRADEGDMPAMDRYDGPAWHMVRAFVRQPTLDGNPLHVFALSAVHGLIHASHPIAWYDQQMTKQRADELHPSVISQFQNIMQTITYHSLCLALSQSYMRALDGWEALVLPPIQVTLANGPTGIKLAQLRAWLHGESWHPSEQPDRLIAAERPRGEAKVGGKILTMSRDEVFETARQQIAHDPIGAQRYRDWYVLVDGYPVSPKWLVSQISGIPVQRFDAGQARKVLLDLGIDIERVQKEDRPR